MAADKRISELTAVASLTGTESLEVVQGGVNKKATTQDIANLASGGTSIPFGATTGTNTYSATMSPVVSAYADGQMYHIRVGNSSTGLVTIDLGPGAKKAFDTSGAQIQDGYLKADVDYVIVYNSTLDAAAGGFTVVNEVIHGFMNLRATYTTGTGLWPSTGGSGPSSGIRHGDTFIAGSNMTLGAKTVNTGDFITTIVDSPGQTDSSWYVIPGPDSLTSTDGKRRLGSVVDVTPDASSGALYSDTSPQTTFTFTSGGITASGGNNDALNYLEYTGYYTNVHRWTRKIRFTPTSDGNGIGLGLESINGKQLGRIILTGANIGKVLIDTYRSGTLTNRVTSTNALTYSNTTDVIELTLDKTFTTYRITAEVIGSSNDPVSVEWVDTLTYPAINSVWAVAHPAIYHFGGDQTITLDKYIVNEYVQNQVAIFSDSIGAGSNAESGDNMWPLLLSKAVSDGVSLVAGGGNATGHWPDIKTEFLSLKPRIAILAVGINDIIAAVSAATTQANILTFIQDCMDNNIIPILAEVLHNGAGNATAVTNLNAWMNGLGFVKVIPVNATMASGTSLNASYDSGDATHPNGMGNRAYLGTVISSIRNIVNIGSSFIPNVIPSGINDSGSLNNSRLIAVTNTNSGTLAAASFRALGNTATGYMTTYSSGYTTTGYANKTTFQNDTAGIMVTASGASGTIEFLVGGATIATNTKVSISTTTFTTTGINYASTNTQNAASTFVLNNASAGVSAASSIRAVSSGGTGTMTTYGGSYTDNTGYASKTFFTNSATGAVVGALGASGTIEFLTGGNVIATHGRGNITSAGLWKIGDSTAGTNAFLSISAGSTTVAPLKFLSGTNLTTAVAGCMEYNGTNLFFTRSGTTREGVLTQSAVTTETVVSDTTVTVNIGGVTYKLLALA